MITFENVKYTDGWDSADFVGTLMTFTIRETNCGCGISDKKICAIMELICEASDSNQPTRMCWCPECRDERKTYGVRKSRETKALAYPKN